MALELETEDSSEQNPGQGLNVYQRIREIKRELFGIRQKKHSMGFSFMSHDDVTAALSPLYVRWGVDREVTVLEALRTDGIIAMSVKVSWVNVDDPLDRKETTVFAEGIDVTKKDGSLNTDGLAAGKGLSYAVKSAELKNFCMVGDKTPDNERAWGGREDPATPPPPPPSSEEYQQLVELYKSCSTLAELQKIREMLSPLVQRKVLTSEQMTELSKLDSEAKGRSK